MRQFPQSLAGPAFNWFYSLENASLKSWDDLVDTFLAKFGVVTDKISVADLVNTKPGRNESIKAYVNRWRNLSIQCERPIPEKEAVEIVLRNIDNWMAPLLKVGNFRTFRELGNCVHQLETSPPMTWGGAPRSGRNFKAETKTIQIKENTSGASSSKTPHNKQTRDSQYPTLEERKNKPYSFRRDKVSRLFDDALKHGLPLPEITRPEEANKIDHPKYCKYHRFISHPIEDCYVFKNWLENAYQKGKINITKNYLQDKPMPHEQVNYVIHGDDPDQPWTLYIPKRTKKMIRAMGTQTGIKWRRSPDPVDETQTNNKIYKK